MLYVSDEAGFSKEIDGLVCPRLPAHDDLANGVISFDSDLLFDAIRDLNLCRDGVGGGCVL